MVETLAAPSLVNVISEASSDEKPLSVGATLTIRAAERHAARAGATTVAASHLLVALLERPDRKVRDYIAGKGASITWLCDTTFAGVSQLHDLGGPDLDTIISAARDEAGSLGQERVDDFCLFLAVLKHGDVLSARLLAEAGLIGSTAAPGAASAIPLEINALIAAPGPFAPRLGAPTWSTMVRHSRWKRNLRALLQAIEVSPIFMLMVAAVLVSGTMLALEPAEQYIRPLIVTFIISVYLVSLCLHEFGHAAAAFLTGERRVKDQGYLTLDIRRYANPLLTFGLPLISLFAGRIPLPGGCVLIQPSMFRSVREERFISAAGPAANLFCLFILSIPLHLGLNQWTPVGVAISAAASLQAGVFIFNLLPIPPLDGWHIVTAGSSHSLRAQAAALGFMPILALLILFRSSPELGTAYWDLVDGFSALFAVEWGPSYVGRWMMSFR